MDEKGRNNVQQMHKWCIECFRCQELGHYVLECLNKKIMILRDDREVESSSDESECESMPAVEDANDVEYTVNDE